MINVLHGEFVKILRNRVIMIFTVTLLPLLTIALLSGLALTTLSGTLLQQWHTINWHEEVILALLVPNNIIGQALFITLAATIFGGEDSWQTWKTILLRSKRSHLILSKFIVTATGIMVAINGVALMAFVGSWMIALAAQKPFISGAWGNVTAPFVVQYAITLLAVFSSMMIGGVFAAFAAVITRSISGGAVIGLIVSLADAASLPMLSRLSALLGNEFPRHLAQLMPSFNIQNLLAWLLEGQGIDGRASWLSGFILVLWICASIALTTAIFVRRDIH